MNHEQTLEQTQVFAEEAAVVDVQCLLYEVMQNKNWKQADLARAMNVSRGRVSQIFSDECSNLTVRLLARALCALGEKLIVTTKSATPKELSGVLDCSGTDDAALLMYEESEIVLSKPAKRVGSNVVDLGAYIKSQCHETYTLKQVA